jgi:DNA-binding beta-propeller fold protein YncE
MAAAGCTLRDRANPLDPRNKDTAGRLSGFNARAGDGAVELFWIPLTQSGILSYEVERWTPGGAPGRLEIFPPHVSAAEDLTVQNDSTYLYRLVAHLASGDSAVSPADTVTPGTRRTMVLVANAPGVAGLSPDGRDIAYVRAAGEPYDDLDLDARRAVFWMSQYDRGMVTGRSFEGTGTVLELAVAHPTDLAISFQRGSLWVAAPDRERVERFGTADTNIGVPGVPIEGVGPARIVEADNQDGTVWVGGDDGGLHRANASTSAVLESWSLGARVNSIAIDEATGGAWVATRTGDLCDLYRVAPGDPNPALVLQGLLNVTDLEVEPAGGTLWISERGAPLAGNGRLTRVGAAGNVLATVTGLEPYALAVEPGSAVCWVTDIRSDRLLLVSPEGVIVRRSPPLGVPYGVRVHVP